MYLDCIEQKFTMIDNILSFRLPCASIVPKNRDLISIVGDDTIELLSLDNDSFRDIQKKIVKTH